MNARHVLIGLAVINLALVGFQLAHGGSNNGEQTLPMLRTRGLELVDDQGRVRAELRVTPANPDVKMPDGSKGYPEAVLLRLITSKNGPNVKLTATEDGAGLVLGGDAGHVQILARHEAPFMKFVTKDGKEQTVKP